MKLSQFVSETLLEIEDGLAIAKEQNNPLTPWLITLKRTCTWWYS